jgi:hypothetical protein
MWTELNVLKIDMEDVCDTEQCAGENFRIIFCVEYKEKVCVLDIDIKLHSVM